MDCGRGAVDIHHIQRRGMGGDDNADRIENLIAVCRECHREYGDRKQYKEMMRSKHLKKIALHGKAI